VVDTAHLRREKGVIYDSIEVVVGTLDSNRQRPAGLTRSFTTHQQNGSSGSQDDIIQGWKNERQERSGHQNGSESYLPQQQHEGLHPTSRRTRSMSSRSHYRPSLRVPEYVPNPEVPDESQMSEKERVRRHETMLLPSQPPQLPATAEASGSFSPLEDRHYDSGDAILPSAPLAMPPPVSSGDGDPGPSAPTVEDIAGPSGTATDDKQEIERRRLLAEASAPPEFPDDYVASNASAAVSPLPPPVPVVVEPSAPVLSDEEEYGAQYSYRAVAGPSVAPHEGGSEPLPKYER
jgi:hypothetical protein